MSGYILIENKNNILNESWLKNVTNDLSDIDSDHFRRVISIVSSLFLDEISCFGESLFDHGINTVNILTAINADKSTRLASLLSSLPYNVISNLLKDKYMSNLFGSDIVNLIKGSLSLSKIGIATRSLSYKFNASNAQKEMKRKMLLAMAVDLRIILIRLSSRLQTLRWCSYSHKDVYKEFAQETIDLYSPLANRLGVWQIKWEIEDLSFRILYSNEYKKIASLLEKRREERELFISKYIKDISYALIRAGIKGEVSGRPKHIYSIWNKMQTKDMDFFSLSDLSAVRVIVNDIKNCYEVLGVIHEIWEPITEEFNDYISCPKTNGYQSLHTVVRESNGSLLEIQIRTYEMHQFAEHGLAAHWFYKESSHNSGIIQKTTIYDKKLSVLRQLLTWGSEAIDIRNAKIYVMTPKAKVIELPCDSTAVDFAYHLHTELGHCCRGARIDGQIVPLQTKLHTGQTVEIISIKSGGPSRDWLNSQLGFLASNRAKIKVRMWFNSIDLQRRINYGQNLVEKELSKVGKKTINLEHLAHSLGFIKAEDLYISVAKDEFSLRNITNFFNKSIDNIVHSLKIDIPIEDRKKNVDRDRKETSGILISGVNNLLTKVALCCRPVPQDVISGFITRGRGVSIHRTNCYSFSLLKSRNNDRVVDANWDCKDDFFYQTDIIVEACDRNGLLSDLSESISKMRLNITGISNYSKDKLSHIIFTVEINRVDVIQRIINSLSRVSGVLFVSRKE
ncbi:GTP pyrophosphokinase [Candidatus Kinetoplastibacterium desouzaii TCC079E]|uniref:GTP pyrophosphokinase n=1 Tax=Candidatus Kinetoplastidibacterium desouzai TCC079E TaxID=1208919 RepID=M1L2P2_9PROT|nr:RelA/SpoT family protein [Candidatus Kinetoplastibacterium desouzaii]AGF47023.1 GTP pyrophosphokinase [Candidatus Kinetoplastibacterium desouzaii TCC079E]